ncbi:MAG TPA: heparinase II/III family protein, partial [Bryobacteraceae bacterium]|nr:heparinase II/III family protein [Bryobacteraceae bacterium]
MSQFDMSQAVRKLKRLGAMGPRELAHRFREKGYAELERIGVGTSRQKAPDGLGFKNYLAGAPSRRFYLSNGDGLRQFVQKNFPSWIERAVSEAETLCRHQVELFSHGPVQLGREIDWHKDPLTAQIWERRFWTDYRLEQDSAGRDPKTIHELNRHQHLPRLAKAYLLSGEERYAREAVAQLNSWIEQNPPGLGINWQSSLETGIRAISWLWTLFPLLPSKSLDAASAERIGASLFAQLEHVHRYTSVFSSPNTHLIGEAAALFIGGLVFADRKRPAAWLERGATLLAQEAEKQVLDDGVYGELSSYYHCYALDFYLQALTLAQRNQFHFPEQVGHRACGMLDFLMHLTRPDGTIPLLGDDDGGRALALEQRNYRPFNDALCVGSVLFRREDFKHQAGAFFEEALWLLGEDAWQIHSLLKGKPPPQTQSFYPRAGYSIQRSGWGPLDSHLVFDCGGLGMLAGGHAHADALSVVLFSGGHELLVDPGTFVY